MAFPFPISRQLWSAASVADPFKAGKKEKFLHMFATASAGYFMTCGAATAAAAGGGGCYVNLMTYSAKWATHMDGHP